MNHYLITTIDQREFLAPNCPDPITALAAPDMPPVCDIYTIDEWRGGCEWYTVYINEANERG